MSQRGGEITHILRPSLLLPLLLEFSSFVCSSPSSYLVIANGIEYRYTRHERSSSRSGDDCIGVHVTYPSESREEDPKAATISEVSQSTHLMKTTMNGRLPRLAARAARETIALPIRFKLVSPRPADCAGDRGVPPAMGRAASKLTGEYARVSSCGWPGFDGESGGVMSRWDKRPDSAELRDGSLLCER